MSEETDLPVQPDLHMGMTFREAVRLRTPMYIGDVGQRGLHYMVNEILANSLEEAGRGFARSISVVLRTDGSVSIADDGRGLPAPLEAALMKPPLPNLSGVRSDLGRSTREVWAIAVANCLSEWMRVETEIEDRTVLQEYRAGLPLGPPMDLERSVHAGISVTFVPDHTIFTEAKLSATLLRAKLEECGFLHSGIRISFVDESTGTNEQFDFEDGIRTYVTKLNQSRTPLHDIAVMRGTEDGIGFEVGIQFCQERDEVIRSYVNDHSCVDLGTHVTGVRVALTQSLKKFARTSGSFPNAPIKWSSTKNGLTAVISIRMANPEFLGAAKCKLKSPEVQHVLAREVGKLMGKYCIGNPDAASAIIQGNAPAGVIPNDSPD